MEVLWSCIRGRPALGGSRVDGFSSSGVLAPPYFSWLYQYDWFHYGCLSSKHWSTVKCRKRTKSLACVPFKEHCKLFHWPTRSCPYVLSARDIADTWAYVCHWHINRINMTGLNWSSFTIDPWWWDVCLIEDTGGRENMQTSASKERRGWEDPLVAQHHELTVNLIYMRSIHVWLERFRDHRLLHELSWIPHGSSNQQCCP